MKYKCVTSQGDTHVDWVNSLFYFFVSCCLIDLKIANDDVDNEQKKIYRYDVLYVFCWTDEASDFHSFFLFVLTHIVYIDRDRESIIKFYCFKLEGKFPFPVAFCCTYKCVKSICCQCLANIHHVLGNISVVKSNMASNWNANKNKKHTVGKGKRE